MLEQRPDENTRRVTGWRWKDGGGASRAMRSAPPLGATSCSGVADGRGLVSLAMRTIFARPGGRRVGGLLADLALGAVQQLPDVGRMAPHQ